MPVIDRDDRMTTARTLPPGLAKSLAESARHSVLTGEPDPVALRLLRESGLLATAVPTGYGGAGGDASDVNDVVRLLAAENPSLAIIAFQHFAVSSRIAEWGTTAQHRELLPRLADGTWLAASAWSEPGAGAAKQRIGTTGRRAPGGDWILDGTKSFATGATVADLYLVLVQTAEPDPAPTGGYGASGQTFFLIEGGNPGLGADLGLDLAGMRGSATGRVVLRGCVVGDDRRLGPEGAATRIIAGVRETGATLGAVAAGIAEGALDLLLDHCRRRGSIESPVTRHRLVELGTEVEAVRAVVDRAGARTAADPGLATLHSKLYASEAAERVCAEVARILSSAGYLASATVNRLLADARAVALMGPTNDLCRDLASTGLLR
ncbi:acyl-CoA dehydrogenase family protein [Mangrovihabitans endophyticus]|uniref:Acyl-CoA dehydrogenase n=1 Tax=Mangrovihabitans endophyticus TaxID=1751298 RepID=A0A8J3FLQ6_9ACTN|nr:acyl-CoA dehydrogenase family protein [Mangrovihabitans endophyticus]GGK74020.1 acyl-CoA dehydrogenase [Mangrovihabitans endophyticus]